MDARRLAGTLAWLASALLFACGDDGPAAADATDPGGEAAADVAPDVPADLPGDPAPDPAPDLPAEAGDEGPADLPVDVPVDVPADDRVDVPEDVPADLPADPGPDVPVVLPPPVSMADYPRMDGSTSNLPLARVIACELLGVPWTWTLNWEGQEKEVVPDPAPGQEELAQWILTTIVHSKTHEAYVRLIEGNTDLVLVASAPSADEQELAAGLGVTLTWTPLALDALVFLLNQQNPMTGLTTGQIRGIFTGTVTNWNEVGGPDQPILPFARPENSGSQQLMQALVMKELSMPAWPEDQVPQFMGQLVDRLKENAFSIGYSVFYYVTYQYSIGGLKLIDVDGATPSSATIADGSYPHIAPVYVVSRSDLDPSSLAGRMRAWLLAPGGQAIVRKSGYVPAL